MNYKIDHRNQLPGLLKEMGLNGTGVEVGVQRGLYSDRILSDSSLNRLYSVDSWIEWPEETYKEVAGPVSNTDHSARYIETVKRLSKHLDRSVVMRMTSADASGMFHWKELDFVYIDASHTYDMVKLDLECWWDKIKDGGVLAGHDYMNDETKKRLGREHYGVDRAVDEFVKEHDLVLHLTKEDYATWYVYVSK